MVCTVCPRCWLVGLFIAYVRAHAETWSVFHGMDDIQGSGDKPGHYTQASASSIEDCQSLCEAKLNCTIFSWNSNSNHCYLRVDGVWALTSNSRVTSGCIATGARAVKNCPAPMPPPPGPPTPAPGQTVSVPAGKYTMGRSGPAFPEIMDDGPITYDEQPAHTVRISAFEIDAAPVSESQWLAYGMEGLPSDASYDAAVAYAAKVSVKTGIAHRLPTEAEWEYAFVKRKTPIFIGAISREWVHDFHGEYPPWRSERVDPGGPRTGILRVLRDHAKPRMRLALSSDATNRNHGFPNATFRLVRQGVAVSALQFHAPPFTQSAILSGTAADAHSQAIVNVAAFGPNPSTPHFAVRFAMPVPPDSVDHAGTATLAGLDPATMWHSHSPGLEVMPNGDILAVYFSSTRVSESANDTRMVQARLRHGATRWDPPELFYDTKTVNDQSGLLWREDTGTNTSATMGAGHEMEHAKSTVRFFGGGRIPNSLMTPFRMGESADSGASWHMRLPMLNGTADDFTPQPITSAWRSADGSGDILFGMDGGGTAGSGASSGLWRSSDNGTTWYDAGGRTAGRHTTFVELRDDTHTIVGLGGKISDIDGWMPAVKSVDGGASYGQAYKLPFPALGGNQRPSVIRLASGRIAFVADAQVKGTGVQPFAWAAQHPLGSDSGVYIALSEDEGRNWTFRFLPVGLPHENDLKNFSTLGYATVRQAPNGVLHVLSTMTHPCLHYELNEAWVLAGSNTHVSTSPVVAQDLTPPKRLVLTEMSRDGHVRASWSALAGESVPRGYAIDGVFSTFHAGGGPVEYNATFERGRRVREHFFDEDGAEIWRWEHDNKRGNSTLLSFFEDGSVRVRSSWLNRAVARDWARIPTNKPTDFHFDGLVAHGTACTYGYDGTLLATSVFSEGKLSNSTTIAHGSACPAVSHTFNPGKHFM